MSDFFAQDSYAKWQRGASAQAKFVQLGDEAGASAESQQGGGFQNSFNASGRANHDIVVLQVGGKNNGCRWSCLHSTASHSMAIPGADKLELYPFGF